MRLKTSEVVRLWKVSEVRVRCCISNHRSREKIEYLDPNENTPGLGLHVNQWGGQVEWCRLQKRAVHALQLQFILPCRSSGPKWPVLTIFQAKQKKYIIFIGNHTTNSIFYTVRAKRNLYAGSGEPVGPNLYLYKIDVMCGCYQHAPTSQQPTLPITFTIHPLLDGWLLVLAQKRAYFSILWK